MIKKLSITFLGIFVLSLALVIGLILSRKVETGDTIIVNYTIRLTDGTVYYTSLGHQPLQETLGEGKFIAGFEEALTGMRVGESKTVAIPVEKAYGQYRPDLVGTVSRDRLPEGVEPVIGKQLRVELKDGTPTIATIIEFTDSTVTLDANHPLAEQGLIFDIQLLGIDDHTPLSSLANVAVLSWAFLALGGLVIGLASFYFIKWGLFLWVRERGLRAIRAVQKIVPRMRLRRVAWPETSLLVMGTLVLGFALVSWLAVEKVSVGDTVRLHYTLKLDDGTVYEASTGGDPLQYTLGEGKLLPGFEEALVGMRAGESKTIRIPPEKAYGPVYPELVIEVERSKLPEGSQPEVGQQVKTTLDDGSSLPMVVTEINETTVTLDGNYPLAGQHLTFDIQLVAVEKNQSAWIGDDLRWVLIGSVGIALGILFFTLRRRQRLQQVRISGTEK